MQAVDGHGCRFSVDAVVRASLSAVIAEIPTSISQLDDALHFRFPAVGACWSRAPRPFPADPALLLLAGGERDEGSVDRGSSSSSKAVISSASPDVSALMRMRKSASPEAVSRPAFAMPARAIVSAWRLSAHSEFVRTSNAASARMVC
ncbi:MAG: hypothetical protein ACXVHQ_32775 [Solirubrobacteraceae bacterium]